MSDKSDTGQSLEHLLKRLERDWQDLAALMRTQAFQRDGRVEARKFVLLDSQGLPRGEWRVGEDGSAGLLLLDPRGRPRAWLGLKEDGSAVLSLRDCYGRLGFEAPGGSAFGSTGAADGEAPGRDGTAAAAAGLEEVRAELAGLKELVLGHLQAESSAAAWSAPPGEDSPPPEGLESFQERLGRLERQNRGLKIAGAGALALLLLIGAGTGFLAGRLPGPGAGPMAVAASGSRAGDLRAAPEKAGKTVPVAAAPDKDTTAPAGQGPRAEPVAGVAGRPPAASPAPGDPGAAAPGAARTPPGQVEPGTCRFVGATASNKYHDPACKWVKKIGPRGLVTFPSVKAAKEAGYIPCPACKPPLAD